MQLRFAKPAHTRTHTHTPIHSLSLSKKCARACGLTVSSLLPESFAFLSSFWRLLPTKALALRCLRRQSAHSSANNCKLLRCFAKILAENSSRKYQEGIFNLWYSIYGIVCSNDNYSAAICIWARRIFFSIVQLIVVIIVIVVVIVCTANGFIG